MHVKRYVAISDITLTTAICDIKIVVIDEMPANVVSRCIEFTGPQSVSIAVFVDETNNAGTDELSLGFPSKYIYLAHGDDIDQYELGFVFFFCVC